MTDYTIQYRTSGRSTPHVVPLDAGGRAEAVAMFKGFKLASQGTGRRCLQLWRKGVLVCGEPVRWERADLQLQGEG